MITPSQYLLRPTKKNKTPRLTTSVFAGHNILMSIPTQNYLTITELNIFSMDRGIDKTLPVGSFIRPIEVKYLPSHITDRVSHEWFNPEKETYAYCSIGIVVIPLNIIRRA